MPDRKSSTAWSALMSMIKRRDDGYSSQGSWLKPAGGISGGGIHQLTLVAKGESAEAD